MQVNRSLKTDAMDHIDHALGRPLDPMAEPSRNHYAIEPDAPLADAFRASPHWQETREFCGMVHFVVTKEGRQTLASHLRDIGDQNRAFDVTYGEYTSTVVATTRGKARYSRYLDISDTRPGLTFGEFCQQSSVRAAA